MTSVPPAPIVLPGESAGFGRRVLAIAIDWFASLGVALVLLGPGRYLTNDFTLTNLAIFFGEVVMLTWLVSSSFGQRLMGIVVVRLDGGRLSLWRAIVRTVLICLVIPAVIFDSDGRGLHDRAVGSVVILRPRRAPGQAD